MFLIEKLILSVRVKATRVISSSCDLHVIKTKTLCDIQHHCLQKIVIFLFLMDVTIKKRSVILSGMFYITMTKSKCYSIAFFHVKWFFIQHFHHHMFFE